jgi:type IV secretory pathway protease TraF
MRRLHERGQALVFLAAVLPLFLAVVGLALDGGHLFAERANLQAVADASARAGAVRVDTARVYREGTCAVFLDPDEAAAAARDYASYHGLAAEAIDAVADDQVVSVQLHQDVPTVFVKVVHIDTVTIRASSVARARYGVDRPLDGV